ncbi:MAG: phage tail assembly protein [Alphaproteobacteria bacterium]|nr:phage tail assembly protein [Alphaproteobacteria bacterium]
MKKIKLSNSVKIDGVEVHELNLRTPKVRDLIAASKKNVSESEREVNLIANLAEVSPETIQDLDLCDYMKIQDWLKDFLSVSTGQN